MVVRNSMAYPQTLQKKTLVARAVAVLPVSEPPMETQLLEGVKSPRIPSYPQIECQAKAWETI